MKQVIFILIFLTGFTVDRARNLAVHQKGMVGPQLIVYKTKKDYSHHVPVILSPDKKRIVSYPAPTDVKTGNTYPIPTRLQKGYLLDNRGIGPDVAYLKLTYKEYAKLVTPLSEDSLLKLIIDEYPLVEMCNCGSRYAMKDPVKEINQKIRKGTLKTDCQVLKRPWRKIGTPDNFGGH